MSFQSVSKCEGATFDCVSSIKVEEEDVVSGHLYVSPEKIVWMNNDGMGIDLFYPKIGTHAVKFEDNSLYMQYNDELGVSDEDEDEEEPLTELRFYLENEKLLEFLYDEICKHQLLYNPSDESADEDEFEEGICGGQFDDV